ncbi:leucine-rich repeat and calponin homology domain-containing protein 3 isoform X8 [Mus caroli]|uniref:Leucine-rich repeat and calponin homology domain-containing protein 3 isoform X8 n=1 Tax=Mus caroli TaxID=10089 RepID=A0A6P7Q7R0_MUSCR|nr:leucine-rich repeat and calponin homology domain-containing protein 3 isoform X8 [Mus caroli]
MAAAGLVAVVAAAEYSGPVASGGNLSGATCGPSPGLGPGPGPGSWSRSVDRALEEAAVTGVLSLSGRKLREFPRGAANHDLTDTTRADLSRNRLSEIPMEACHFVSLESLNLYQNCIRYIPEAVLNLQALTFLNISRNQLSTLPVHLCNLPLKVLIASNNKLVSLPEEIGHLRHLTELDVSCNEIQTVPSQIGNLEALRDFNVRRNHLLRLPEELAEVPLIRLDFSCNKITVIPVCYRNLRHLQVITLDNNPLQSPPAQICIKGKIHIFKYLNIQACKIAPDLPDYERRPLGFGSCHEELYPGRPYGALDSGFNSVDSGDKRWSGNEPTDEFSDLPLRVAEITKEQRLRRESQYQENRSSVAVTNGGVEHDLDQIDYIDSCTTEEDENDVKQPKSLDTNSLSSQFMAYIEQRRISHEVSPVKPIAVREFQKTEDMKRYSHQNRVPVEPSLVLSMPPSHNQQKTSHNPERQPLPGDGECPFPSRRSQHTDDSALLVSLSGLDGVSCVATRPHSSAFTPLKSENRVDVTSSFPMTETGRASPLLLSSAPATDPTDAITRQREEELKLIDQLRKHIEYRLKVSLPCDLGAALTDGVVLCHLANHVRPRSVPSIHVPSPAVPKLTMAKCRRNVENFLDACRKIGVPQEQLCLPLHILEEKGLGQVAVTVQALLELAPPKQPPPQQQQQPPQPQLSAV